MGWLIPRYQLTAGIIVGVSEVAKRNDKFGALLVTLPTVTILVVIRLYLEGQPTIKIANHLRYTFWYVRIPVKTVSHFGFIRSLHSAPVPIFLSVLLVGSGYLALLTKKLNRGTQISAIIHP